MKLLLETSVSPFQEVYVCGNFNGWNPQDSKFKMNKNGNGIYEYTFASPLNYPFEYKYTLGGWDYAELDPYGNPTPNRFLREYDAIEIDRVEKWRNSGKTYRTELKPRIEIISEKFSLPSPIKTRRISVLLPSDYYRTNTNYPVLYLQDGQNLFDDFAPYGNWALDKKLAILAERGSGDVIIVAIDHAAENRINEFTPSHRTVLGVGEGKDYVKFLVTELKPWIDLNYRTKEDRIHTGIGGSSMGGLISMYAGLIYPEVYSKFMILSPALWVDPNLVLRTDTYFANYQSRIYMHGGAKESPTMVPNMKLLKTALMTNRIAEAQIQFYLSVDPKGLHNEAAWGKVFPKALEWLFFPEHIKY